MASDGPGETSSVLLTILSSQRRILDAMSSSASEDDLTLQQFAMLRLVGRAGPLPMNKLSEELRVSPPNITGIVDRLEKKGLVKRVESQADRRTKEIHLTETGNVVLRRVRKGYTEALQESLDALTPEEQDILAKLMRKLAREIENREGRRRPRRSSLKGH
ncbi:MAG TPA: MarR family transcriptional regulator [Nitrososphaerales archaeon]|nr:MarR family transcriptional regulator [Nitrososphaerales archaeon]